MSSRTTGPGVASSSSRRTLATAAPGNNANNRTAPAARPSSSASAARPGPNPLFGLEIEIFVKLRPEIECAIKKQRQTDIQPEEPYWRDWDLTLGNGTGKQNLKAKQRKCVGQAIEALIEGVLGPTHAWSCEADASLKEYKLTEPPEPRKWWGIEIISPPMSAGRKWQEEVRQVFAAVDEEFELWTNSFCACHVHVSPGPLRKNSYTFDQLVQIASASQFWEMALQRILPEERRNNRYAMSNNTAFATAAYNNVPYATWGPVFQEIKDAAASSRKHMVPFVQFGYLMAGANPTGLDATDTGTRYLSSNFLPLDRLGTVELRRQAGVASARTAIYRALLALTLHVSALRYNFAAAAARGGHASHEELISELAGCIKQLPEQCRGARFVKWLKECAEDYAPGCRPFTEREVNHREHSLHAQDTPLRPAAPASSAARQSGRQRAPSTAQPPPQPVAQPRSQRVVPTPAQPTTRRQNTAAPTHTQRPAREPPQRGVSYVTPTASARQPQPPAHAQHQPRQPAPPPPAPQLCPVPLPTQPVRHPAGPPAPYNIVYAEPAPAPQARYVPMPPPPLQQQQQYNLNGQAADAQGYYR
ncbi:hypothetical protein BT67DRAFT_432870 [Trichocladium antarcticum]|uniref:Amidoligase enzyme-domain-containing protein n=1 Tax=Trichocladium antarcticum TaxID=1450529 RepID=A0AAN6ZEF5_9PEZI|nr:hypothetical protein BT67DRAFT_432870 [Trichocladium antarcticum]